MAPVARVLVGAVVLAAAGAPFSAAADGEIRPYVGGPGDLLVVCGDGARPGVGGACFEEVPDVPSATISIEDEVTGPTAGSYLWIDEGGQGTAVGFCGSTSVEVPAGAVELDVLVSEAFGPVDCPRAGVGTAGTIAVDWGAGS